MSFAGVLVPVLLSGLVAGAGAAPLGIGPRTQPHVSSRKYAERGLDFNRLRPQLFSEPQKNVEVVDILVASVIGPHDGFLSFSQPVTEPVPTEEQVRRGMWLLPEVRLMAFLLLVQGGMLGWVGYQVHKRLAREITDAEGHFVKRRARIEMRQLA